MSLILNRPRYHFEPIRNAPALARSLNTQESILRKTASVANQSYSIVPPAPGSNREIFNAHRGLKAIHKKIKDELLVRVYFPEYLTGSIKGRDYVTNAKLHGNKKSLICEDVKKFFPSVLSEKVQDVWQHFFGFSDEVARLLTQLTTKDGALPQGAITSSYLANLVLWRDEPLLEAKLSERGITYSRYVDDIAMSADRRLNKLEISDLIADVYGMLRRNGLSAGRKKHEFFTDSEPMIVTKLIVNRKPSLPPIKRSNVRAQLFQLERRIAAGELTTEVARMIDSAANKVGYLGRFHSKQAADFKSRLKAARASVLQQGGISCVTTPASSLLLPSTEKPMGLPPWDQ
jgi:Reverse transcriptase (RNA-dependent DNA polymerase)